MAAGRLNKVRQARVPTVTYRCVKRRARILKPNAKTTRLPTTGGANSRIQGKALLCCAAPPVLGKPTTVGAIGVFSIAGVDPFPVFRAGVFGAGVFGIGVFGTSVFVGCGMGVSVRPTGAFGVSALASGGVPKTKVTIVRPTKR
jgi:hypothetical protein